MPPARQLAGKGSGRMGSVLAEALRARAVPLAGRPRGLGSARDLVAVPLGAG